MKLHSLIATALVFAIGSVLLAQQPAEKTKPATTEKATPPEPDLHEKLDVYVEQLKHGSVEQRREAVVALGRIGERAKAAASALAEALKSEDAALRVGVAEALWQANKDPAAVTALAAALKDKDWRVFQCAAEALERIGPEAKAAVPALLELLADGWVWERKWAAWAPSVCTAPGCQSKHTNCFPDSESYKDI